MDTEPKPEEKYSLEKDIELRKMLKDTMQRIMAEDYENFLKFYEELVNRSDYLRTKYPNHEAESYPSFHVIALSTVDINKLSKKTDFSGNDSIEKFVKDLIERYK